MRGESVYNEMDIAIVGWSCRFAGSDRVASLACRAGDTPVPAGGPIRKELDHFDAEFFNIPAQHATTLEPDRCVFLQLAREALENAGYDANSSERIGVFAGVPKPLERAAGASDSDSEWVAANLGLTGENVTAEESELPFIMAVLRAHDSLRSGKTDIALTGAFSAQGAPESRARGGGVLVMKRLADALQARDTVHAVVRQVTLANSLDAQGTREVNPASEVAAFIDAASAVRRDAPPVSRSIRSGAASADVLFESAGEPIRSAGISRPLLLPLSAKSGAGLDQVTLAIREFLDRSPSIDMDDVAYTLQRSRASFAHRRMLVCLNREDALNALAGVESNRIFSARPDGERRPAIFMLPGIGDQYVGMAHDLYASWEIFRREVDRCAQILEPLLGLDIRSVLYPANQEWKKAAQSKGIDLKRMLGRGAAEPVDPDTALLNTTRLAQPALFTVEYAMAQLWLSLGIVPDAMVGHSMGEYVAACLAGVFSLEDALRLIAVRAKLVNELPEAIMLAVMLPEEELRAKLPEGVHLSLINGPSHCVIAGPPAAMTVLEQSLAADEIIARRVQNGHPFHTPMMEPVLADFAAELATVRLHEPKIRYLSNVTGDWVTAAQATDPSYWIQHLSRPARFSDGLRQLWQLANPLLIECGPGRTLSVLAAQHPERKATLQSGIWTMRQRYENELDERVLLTAIGKVWLAGGAISWDRMAHANAGHRIPLPVYPHDTKRYWASSAPATELAPVADASHGATAALLPAAEDDNPANPRERELVRIWQNALGRPSLGVNDSFGALGGDSLSSIGVVMEMKRLGISDEVARGLYHGLTIRQIARQSLGDGAGRNQDRNLEGRSPSVTDRIKLGSTDTAVFLRATAMFIVVAGHFGMTDLQANPVMMMISGMSFARFQLQTIAKLKNIAPVFNFALRVAIPSVVITVLRQVVHPGAWHWKSLLLIDNLVEPWPFGTYQSPYFVDLLIQNLVIAAVPLSIGPVRRFALTKPYAYAMTFLTASLAVNLGVHWIWDPTRTWIFVPHIYMWLLAMGWCIACSNTDRQRIITSVALVVLTLITTYAGTGVVMWYMVVAALVLIWFDELPARLPQGLITIINSVAAASLFIYLTHMVFQRLLPYLPTIVVVAIAMATGFLVWRAWFHVSRLTMGWLGKLGWLGRPKLQAAAGDSW